MAHHHPKPRYSTQRAMHDLNHRMDHHHELLHQIKEGMLTMATRDELQEQLDELGGKIDEASTRVVGEVGGLKQQIADLMAQIEQAGDIPQDIIDSVNALDAKADAIAAAAAPEEPAPDVA